MDPVKVETVGEWPVPASKKPVQWFPWISQLLPKVCTRLRKNSGAIDCTCKAHHDPYPANPGLQFVIVSNGGVERHSVSAISERSQTFHPCAFFSRRFSPAKKNYENMDGKQELLAVKMAQEEWRHLLERAQVPFLLWTDHKNLEYLKAAHRPRNRQGGHRFFSCFNFTLLYRLKAKNQFAIRESVVPERVFDVSGGPHSSKTQEYVKTCIVCA